MPVKENATELWLFPGALPSRNIAQLRTNEAGIFPRRYFYPSLDTRDLADLRKPDIKDLAKRVLCLPMYATLPLDVQIDHLNFGLVEGISNGGCLPISWSGLFEGMMKILLKPGICLPTKCYSKQRSL